MSTVAETPSTIPADSTSTKASDPRWIPLESNPEVLNDWASKLGLMTLIDKFDDVYGLDPELLSLVPQPTKAILLIFPINEQLETNRKAADEKIKTEGQEPIDPSLCYIEQTIPNACGTIGMLHALANTDITLAPESSLAKFIREAQGKTPSERAKLLEKTDLFAKAHVDAALLGQSAVPTADELDTNLHFICFVSAMHPGGPGPAAVASGEPNAEGEVQKQASEDKTGQMRLIELDGRRNGPVDLGPCADLLTDVAKIVREKYISLSTSMHFGMIALGPNQD